MCTVTPVHQFNADQETLSTPQDSAGNDLFDSEFTRDLLNVYLFVLVLETRIARDNFDAA